MPGSILPKCSAFTARMLSPLELKSASCGTGRRRDHGIWERAEELACCDYQIGRGARCHLGICPGLPERAGHLELLSEIHMDFPSITRNCEKLRKLHLAKVLRHELRDLEALWKALGKRIASLILD